MTACETPARLDSALQWQRDEKKAERLIQRVQALPRAAFPKAADRSRIVTVIREYFRMGESLEQMVSKLEARRDHLTADRSSTEPQTL